MSNPNVHNLNDGRAQALQALQRVSERLGDILGEAGTLPADGTRRNESGELVNEEGLPIIDITEPIDELDTPSLSAATEEDEAIEEDNYPEPISKLSPEALAISRQHRDKILDLLEGEETREEQRTQQEEQAELEQKREAARSEMQKRMMTQGSDLEKRRRAKELDKRMAKALVSGLGEPAPAAAVPSKPVPQSPEKKEKKAVTFAGPLPLSESTKLPAQPKQPADAVAWGDVVPGRLPKKRGLHSSSRSQPMKMEVVERPTASKSSHSLPPPSPPPEPSKPAEPAGDSDDESDSEEASDSTIALESGDEDVVLSAHHHRELALEYHRRREALASSAGAVELEDTGFGDGEVDGATDGWDTEEVPIEATLARPPPKPPVSKFKASLPNRTTSPASEPLDPAPASTFGASVLPPTALAKSIKMGKLVDGNLVAGEEDEEEKEREAREEEEIRKLLLKSMEDYSGIAAQVMGASPAGSGSYWAKPDAEKMASSSSTAQSPDKPKHKPEVSRFKVNRTQARAPSNASTGPSSSVSSSSSASASTSSKLAASSAIRPRPSTPLSEAGRSSPKLTPGSAPAETSKSPSNDGLHTTILDSAPLRGDFSSSSTSVRQSPSFRPGRLANGPSSHPIIVDSPSFQAPQSTIIDSPSFVHPGSSSPGSQAPHMRKSPTVISTLPMRSAKRDTTVMANEVRERSGDQNSSGVLDTKPQRVSRFKAERGG